MAKSIWNGSCCRQGKAYATVLHHVTGPVLGLALGCGVGVCVGGGFCGNVEFESCVCKWTRRGNCEKADGEGKQRQCCELHLDFVGFWIDFCLSSLQCDKR